MFHPKLSRLANILLLKTTNKICSANQTAKLSNICDTLNRDWKTPAEKKQKTFQSIHPDCWKQFALVYLLCVCHLCIHNRTRRYLFVTMEFSFWRRVQVERYEPCFLLFSDHHLYIAILLTKLIHYIPNVDNILRSGTLIKQKTTVSYLFARRKKICKFIRL